MRHLGSRDGSTRLAAIFGAGVLVLLAVAAFFLATTQAQQRDELRDRYADRLTVANALLDSLFRATFVGQTTGLTQRFGGSEVSTAELDRQVLASEAMWAAVIDASGRVLGASSRAPAGEVRLLAARQFVQKAFAGSGYALGDVETGGTLPTAVRFFARSALAGSRTYVSAQAPATLSRFLESTLGPLPGVSGARAYIIDGNGHVVAGLARDSAPAPRRIALLLGALRRGPTGSFVSENGEDRFYASQGISRSRWKLVVTVPEATLYESASGPSRWIPWIILAVSAVALLGIVALLRRLLQTTDALQRTNDELAFSNTELARSNADLEQFAYVASHDLSEPLRTVAGFSQLLAHRYGGQLDSEADLYIEHMGSGVQRMQALIDDLLRYSRVGREPLEPRRVDLDGLLDDVLDAIGSTIRERGAEVTRDDLPAVRGEPGQLAQVFQNLLVNALKFTAPDVTPRIHVSARREGRQARITVRDNGIGIPPEQRGQIFKMFGRLHPAEAYEGTGIGLALVQRIVERHGGRIWVEPAGGTGSRFTFTLPEWSTTDRPAPRERVPA